MSSMQGGAPPHAFRCPVTLDVMEDPVATCDGHIFERAAIKTWLSNHATSPATGARLANSTLFPVPGLRKEIREWRLARGAGRPTVITTGRSSSAALEGNHWARMMLPERGAAPGSVPALPPVTPPSDARRHKRRHTIRPCSAGLCSRTMACGMCSATRVVKPGQTVKRLRGRAPGGALGSADEAEVARAKGHKLKQLIDKGRRRRAKAPAVAPPPPLSAVVLARRQKAKELLELAAELRLAVQGKRRRELELTSLAVRSVAADSGPSVATMHAHEGAVHCLATLQLSDRLVSAGEDARIIVWRTNPDCRKIRVLTDHTQPVFSLAAVIQNGEELLASGSIKKILLWSTKTWQVLKTLEEIKHDAFVWGLVAIGAPGGAAMLASCSADMTVRLWCIDKTQYEFGECGDRLEGHRDSVYCICVFPCGERVATGSADKTIILWRVEVARAKNGASLRLHTLRGHQKLVHAVQPLGHDRLATSSLDSSIRIWDAGSGRCLRLLRQHAAPVTTLLSVPDPAEGAPGLLISGARDGVLKIWEQQAAAPPGRCKPERCLRTVNNGAKQVSALTVVAPASGRGMVAAGCTNGAIQVWAASVGSRAAAASGSGVASPFVASGRQW